MDVASLIAAHEIFAPLPVPVRATLAGLALSCALGAGETSNAAGEDGFIVVVGSGTLRASALVDGRIVFHDIEAGGVLGLTDAVLGRSPPPSALLALSDVEAVVLPAPAVIDAITQNAAAALALAGHLARLLDRRASAADPLQLVYRDILRAAKPMGDALWTVDPMPRHRELAQRAGVGEEEAASAVANLVRLGVARRRYPALDIEDREALRSLAL